MKRSLRLRHIFEKTVIGISTLSCGGQEPPNDAGGDATLSSDAPSADAPSDVTFVFSDAGIQRVCDGATIPVAVVCGSCCNVLDVPCKITPYDDAGSFASCDAICLSPNEACALYRPGTVALPPDASLDDEAGTYVVCACTGRLTSGVRVPPRRRASLTDYYVAMAELEAASVFAFRRLYAELRQLGAPRSLLASVAASAADETRHTRMMERIASHRVSRSSSRERTFRHRSVERIAIENATEGCVREMYGALVATWQKAHATDERARKVFAVIARDETRHAVVALRVASFLESKLSVTSRRRVVRAQSAAIEALHRSAATSPEPELAPAGLPNARQALALIEALRTEVWS